MSKVNSVRKSVHEYLRKKAQRFNALHASKRPAAEFQPNKKGWRVAQGLTIRRGEVNASS